MRRVLSTVLLATLGFASAVHGASALPAAAEASDQFSVIGIKVDATGLSPRAARELAMNKAGRSLGASSSAASPVSPPGYRAAARRARASWPDPQQ